MIDYQIHDISEKHLKFGHWFLKYRRQLIKLLAAMLIVWSIITTGYGIYGFVDYGLKLAEENRMLAEMAVNSIDFFSFKQRHQPQPLIITAPQIINTGSGLYDFMAQAKNPNKERGVINLSYSFVSGDYSTPVSSIVILPQQTVFLLSLSNSSEKRLTGAELKVIGTQWQSLWNRTDVEEVEISTSEPKFQTGLGSSRSWVSFLATNASLRNVWEVAWQAVLYSGKRVVAVNQIISEELLAGEAREIEISWFEKLPKVTQIDLVPIVNIYDPNIFFDIPGQAGELYY
ncbi:hypothetical protein KJ840_04745 [Patescibacteria group bacterium]|nr:hypothetical protein [Patescibacteria group bacterium]